jgi:hypothetical protein
VAATPITAGPKPIHRHQWEINIWKLVTGGPYTRGIGQLSLLPGTESLQSSHGTGQDIGVPLFRGLGQLSLYHTQDSLQICHGTGSDASGSLYQDDRAAMTLTDTDKSLELSRERNIR